MLYEYLQKLKGLDLMTPPVQLNIGGKSGVKTYFGVAMTIMYLTSICIFSYLIVLTYLATDSPSINEDISLSEVNPRVDMIENQLFPVIYVLAQGTHPIPAAAVGRYFTITYNKFRVIEDVYPNGTAKVTYKSFLMPVIPCSQALQNDTLAQVYNNYQSTEYFRNHGNTSGLCPQFFPDESYVLGGGSQQHIDMLQLEFYPCNFTDSSKCATLAELLYVNVIVTQPSSSLILGNFTNPVKSYLNADVNYFINTQMTQKYSETLMYTEIWDQSQIFDSKTLRKNYSSVEKTVFISQTRDPTQIACPGVAQFDLSLCYPYLIFQFSSGPTKHKFVRSYKTLMQTLSQLGGINSVVLLVFLYINLIYNYYAKKKLLVEKVFMFFVGLNDRRAKKPADHFDIRPGEALQVNSSDGNTPSNRKKQELQERKTDVANPLAKLSGGELEEMRNEAYEVIMKNLDVITLVREVNNLKVLTHLLFADYQQKLMPLISLNIQAKKHRLKKRLELLQKDKPKQTVSKVSPDAQRAEPSSPGTPEHRLQTDGNDTANPSRSENREPGGTMSFNAALLMLEANRERAQSVPQEDRSLQQKVDAFCCEALDRSAPPPVNPSSPIRIASRFDREQLGTIGFRSPPIPPFEDDPFQEASPSNGQKLLLDASPQHPHSPSQQLKPASKLILKKPPANLQQ